MLPILLAMVLLALLGGTDHLLAQGAERTSLSHPDRSYNEAFSSIVGLRELSDGRVIVADRLEQVVRILDFETGTYRDIGRTGAGPGEYQTPAGLLPLPGDSSLLIDFGNMRLTVISPQGRMSRSMPLYRDDGLFIRPTAADGNGRLYFQVSNVAVRSSGGRIEFPDSLAIGRWSVATDEIDTVGYLALPKRDVSRTLTSTNGNMRLVGTGASPLSTRDAWTVAPDGRVGFVYGRDYHVEWMDGQGGRIVGPEIEYEMVEVTKEDENAWAEQQAGNQVTLAGSGGGRTMSLPRPDIEELDWPDFKPPFPPNAAWVTPEGELWVERYVGFGEPQSFDVFDAEGGRIKHVVLPEGRKLVGFGSRTVYLVNVDENDLQWLERYGR